MVRANFPAPSGGSDEACDRLADRSRLGRGAPWPGRRAPAKSLAITGVTVIDATGAPAWPDMTVVVTGDRITAVGKSGEVQVPKGARVVEGNGKYLIPGLWDMHVHTADPSFLPLYLANGVTGVRDMHALDPGAIFGLRKQVQEGKQPGPRVVAAGPLVDGPKPLVPGSLVAANAAEGREAVRKLKKMGANFVKVYTKLPREAYLSIADEAKKQGLPFAGHVPESVSAALASDLGQKSIEHLTGVELACSDREDELRREAVATLAKADNQAAMELLGRIGARAADSFSDKKARALYARFVRNGTWHVPTLTVLHSLVNLDDPKFTADPRVKYMPPSLSSYWSLIKLSPETAAGLLRTVQAGDGSGAGDAPGRRAVPGRHRHARRAVRLPRLQPARRAGPARRRGRLHAPGGAPGRHPRPGTVFGPGEGPGHRRAGQAGRPGPARRRPAGRHPQHHEDRRRRCQRPPAAAPGARPDAGGR